MDLESLAAKIVTTFGGKETEQNWEKIDALLKELSGELPGCSNEEVISAVKRCREVLLTTVLLFSHCTPTFLAGH